MGQRKLCLLCTGLQNARSVDLQLPGHCVFESWSPTFKMGLDVCGFTATECTKDHRSLQLRILPLAHGSFRPDENAITEKKYAELMDSGLTVLSSVLK